MYSQRMIPLLRSHSKRSQSVRLSKASATLNYSSFFKSWTKHKGSKNATPLAVLDASQALSAALQSGEKVSVMSAMREFLSAHEEGDEMMAMSRKDSRLLDRAFASVEQNAPLDLAASVLKISASSEWAKSLASKAFTRLAQDARLSSDERIRNGMVFFEALIKQSDEIAAFKFVSALIRSAPTKIWTAAELKTVQDRINADTSLDAIKSVMLAFQTCPPAVFTETCLDAIKEQRDLYPTDAKLTLESTVEYLFFTQPHFEIKQLVLVKVLQLLSKFRSLSLGRNVLRYARQRFPSENDESFLRTLLFACIDFQDSVPVGEDLVKKLEARGQKNLSHSTQASLAQWSVYNSTEIATVSQTLDSLIKDGFVLEAADVAGLLKVASESSVRSENYIRQLIDLVHGLDVDLDASCFCALIHRYISFNELDKARNAFLDSVSQGVDWNSGNGKFQSVLSELLVAICHNSNSERATIVDTFNRINILDPAYTVAAQAEILKLFLGMDDLKAAATFLKKLYGSPTPSLSYTKYRPIYDTFHHRIMELDNQDMAWELFSMLNCTIVLPYERYFEFQLKFCNIGRPDAAQIIFRHMRTKFKDGTLRPPSDEMYKMLLRQYTKSGYREGISELETYFRMDLNNELDSQMMNHLIAANLSLENLEHVTDLWMEISSFPPGKGVNNDTITLMLQCCTLTGLEVTDDIWTSMGPKYGLKPTEANLRQYVIANCLYGYSNRARQLIASSDEKYGIKPSNAVLEALYNWSFTRSDKDRAAAWIKKTYPDNWKAIEESGKLEEVLLGEDNGESPVRQRFAAAAKLNAGSSALTVTL